MVRISEDDFFRITGKRLPVQKKKNKYNAQKVDGYDSKKEKTRADELKMWQKLGLIFELKEQVKFVLQENFKIPSDKTKQGFETVPAISYISDFTYKKDGEKKLFVEDVKSEFTRKNPLYSIKRKLLLYKYPNIIFNEEV